MDKISVIIPAYNAEKTIVRCIDSIINQTYVDLEIIVINDGSRDDTLNLCEKYNNDKRFILINKENEGVSIARNTGIDISSGDYIVFVDSDDFIPSDAIATLVMLKNEYNIDLVCASYKYIKKYNRTSDYLLEDTVYKNEDYIYNLDNILNKIYTGPVGKLFRADIVKNNKIYFPKNISYGEDTIFLYTYLQNINSICFNHNIVYYYDIREAGSLSRSYCKSMCEYLYCIFQAKIQLLKNFNYQGLTEVIEKYSIYEFEKSLAHYILYEKDKEVLDFYIKLSVEKFNIEKLNSKYLYFIKNNDFASIKKLWIKDNLKYFIKERIKIYFLQ